MLLENKKAIVTGGSRGIGLATCKEFLKEGALVTLCGSRKETVEKAVDELKKEFPNSFVKGIYPNLKDFDEVTKEFDEAIKEMGGIDILVNNAGISDDKKFVDYTFEHFDNVLDINIRALFICSKIVSDYMIKQNSGVILNTSSMVSRDGTNGGVAYPTSKFAVNGFTLSLARELAQYNIRVNAVAPGVTYTDMMRAVPEEYITPIINSIPLKRLGEAEDIANAFTFLASDKASYISGQVLHVDGLGRV